MNISLTLLDPNSLTEQKIIHNSYEKNSFAHQFLECPIKILDTENIFQGNQKKAHVFFKEGISEPLTGNVDFPYVGRSDETGMHDGPLLHGRLCHCKGHWK